MKGKNKYLILLFSISAFILLSCSNESQNNQTDEKEYIFYYLTTDHNYSWGKTNLLEEYHCKDLGDDYYEVISYTVNYFSGKYLKLSAEQLIEIVKKRGEMPTSVEKKMTTGVLSKTIKDYSSKKSVVIYTPSKIKYELYYYEAGYK